MALNRAGNRKKFAEVLSIRENRFGGKRKRKSKRVKRKKQKSKKQKY